MDSITLRNVAVLALLAIAPWAGYYFLVQGAEITAGVLSLGCILLIAGSIYTFFGPSEASEHAGDAHGH
jgi:hypothetical protein